MLYRQQHREPAFGGRIQNADDREKIPSKEQIQELTAPGCKISVWNDVKNMTAVKVLIAVRGYQNGRIDRAMNRIARGDKSVFDKDEIPTSPDFRTALCVFGGPLVLSNAADSLTRVEYAHESYSAAERRRSLAALKLSTKGVHVKLPSLAGSKRDEGVAMNKNKIVDSSIDNFIAKLHSKNPSAIDEVMSIYQKIYKYLGIAFLVFGEVIKDTRECYRAIRPPPKMSGDDFVQRACKSALNLYSSTSYTQEKAENFLIDESGKERACCVLVCKLHPGIPILDINAMQPKRLHSYDEDEWLIPPSCEWTLTDLKNKKYKKCDIKPTARTEKLFHDPPGPSMFIQKGWVTKMWLSTMRSLFQTLKVSYTTAEDHNAAEPFYMT